MADTYKVHIGGRKYRKFATIETAQQYCSGYFETSGIVLSIVADVPKRKTAKQVRAKRDASNAARFAAMATETTRIGSDHRSWEVRKTQFVAGAVRQFNSLPGDFPNRFQAFGRSYLSSPMEALGMFSSLTAAVARIDTL